MKKYYSYVIIAGLALIVGISFGIVTDPYGCGGSSDEFEASNAEDSSKVFQFNIPSKDPPPTTSPSSADTMCKYFCNEIFEKCTTSQKNTKAYKSAFQTCMTGCKNAYSKSCAATSSEDIETIQNDLSSCADKANLTSCTGTALKNWKSPCFENCDENSADCSGEFDEIQSLCEPQEFDPEEATAVPDLIVSGEGKEYTANKYFYITLDKANSNTPTSFETRSYETPFTYSYGQKVGLSGMYADECSIKGYNKAPKSNEVIFEDTFSFGNIVIYDNMDIETYADSPTQVVEVPPGAGIVVPDTGYSRIEITCSEETDFRMTLLPSQATVPEETETSTSKAKTSKSATGSCCTTIKDCKKTWWGSIPIEVVSQYDSNTLKPGDIEKYLPKLLCHIDNGFNAIKTAIPKFSKSIPPSIKKLYVHPCDPSTEEKVGYGNTTPDKEIYIRYSGDLPNDEYDLTATPDTEHTLVHEVGHVVDQKLYITAGGTSEWGAAVYKHGPAVSTYSNTDDCRFAFVPCEDFAETFTYWIYNNKYYILEKIWNSNVHFDDWYKKNHPKYSDLNLKHSRSKLAGCVPYAGMQKVALLKKAGIITREDYTSFSEKLNWGKCTTSATSEIHPEYMELDGYYYSQHCPLVGDWIIDAPPSKVSIYANKNAPGIESVEQQQRKCERKTKPFPRYVSFRASRDQKDASYNMACYQTSKTPSMPSCLGLY